MTPVSSSQVPRLLVSVRSREEAAAALAGGCDILDVKEPTRGPLGMASRSVIASIAEFAGSNGVRCSAACGEAIEAAGPFSDQAVEAEVPVTGLEFFKLGPAQLVAEPEWQTRWTAAWQQAADAFETPANCTPAAGPHAVAVVYADWQRAGAPSPDEILDAVVAWQSERSVTGARGPKFVGILIDTFDKSSGGLLDCLSVAELEAFATRARSLTAADAAESSPMAAATSLDGGSRLFLALAGRLSSRHLGHLISIRPDVIAVRSAACRNQDRQSTVDAAATRQFRAEMQTCFGESPVEPVSLVSAETGQ